MVASLDFTMVVRLIISAIFGGIVGMERGSGDRPAGFRTHILVCAGSTLLMLVSLYGFDGFDAQPFEYPRNRDSARIAAQVVSGIGFLGAGTILHEGVTVRGLTTAASLWMVSAIGLAVGAGMYLVGAMATGITMITLVTFHNWEKRFAGTNRTDRRFVRVVADNKPGTITDVTSYLAENGVKVKTMNVKTATDKKHLVLELYLKVDKVAAEADPNTIISGIQDIEGVFSLENVN
jgi:putative Mg2+ transporter-C (MgtC) family protein